uniref:hypothetical protein n=1 Tax=Klebsiella pneumoniae TaxID=573 RepID=UPI001C8F83BC
MAETELAPCCLKTLNATTLHWSHLPDYVFRRVDHYCDPHHNLFLHSNFIILHCLMVGTTYIIKMGIITYFIT